MPVTQVNTRIAGYASEELNGKPQTAPCGPPSRDQLQVRALNSLGWWRLMKPGVVPQDGAGYVVEYSQNGSFSSSSKRIPADGR